VSGVVVPFVASSLLARFWPAVRHLWQALSGRMQQAWHSRGTIGETSECMLGVQRRGWGPGLSRLMQTPPPPKNNSSKPPHNNTCADWSAEFVAKYSQQEERQRQHEQQQQQQQQRGGGGAEDAGESFEEFMRDPFGWVERELRRQQQRAQQQQQGGSAHRAGDEYYEQQRRQQQQRQGQRRTAGSGRGPAAAAGGGGDPRGYYRRLGVKPDCSTQELSEAFRGLALKHHPDRAAAPDKAAATKRFQVSGRGCRGDGGVQCHPYTGELVCRLLTMLAPLPIPQQELSEAYQVLRDPRRRQRYDVTGQA